MLRLLRARVFDWLLMAVAVTIGAVVLPAMFSTYSTEDFFESSIMLVPRFMGVFIIMDLTLRTTLFTVSFVAKNYFGETLRKHLRNYGIGIPRPEEKS